MGVEKSITREDGSLDLMVAKGVRHLFDHGLVINHDKISALWMMSER